MGFPRAPQWCCTGAAGAGQLTGCGADAVLAAHGPGAAPPGSSGSSPVPPRFSRLLPAPPGPAARRPPKPGRPKRIFAARLKVVTRRALNRWLFKQRFKGVYKPPRCMASPRVSVNSWLPAGGLTETSL